MKRMRPERMPAISAARGLIPTASIESPRAVLRTTSTKMARTTSARRKPTGNPRTRPCAIQLNEVEFPAAFLPPVIILAIPRPASIMIKVVMNGWRRTTETRNPENAPQSTPTRRARSTATIAAPALDGEGELTRNCIATAPETAITEPTERSMPLVAITSVMPREIIRIGGTKIKRSMIGPVSRPFV